MKRIHKIVAILTLICYLFALCPFQTATVAATTDNSENTGSKIIVSLGDSYSSGEGIQDFYDQNLSLALRVQSEDWLAHRSQHSWSGKLTLEGVGTMKDHRDTNWYFVASSGATAKDVLSCQEKYYHKYAAFAEYEDTYYLPPQIDVFEKLGDKKADYVTMTLGGNDVNFGEIVKKVVMGFGSVTTSGLEDEIEKIWKKFYTNGGSRNDIKRAYATVAETAGSQATVLIAGYPEFFDESGKGLPVSKRESELVNEAIRQFNNELSTIVTELQDDGYNIEFVPVAQAFKGHECYTSDSYMTELKTAGLQDLNDWDPVGKSSFHPNKKGAEAYAKCLQDRIDALEKEKKNATSTEREIVLVLDNSGSMYGTPLDETKKAARNFVTAAINNEASVGIVTYNTTATRVSSFSISEKQLKANIDLIGAGDSTNIDDGLTKAEEMLRNSKAKKKIIVLMSDGAPNVGRVAEELIAYANELKEQGITIYTLGFFESLGSDCASEQQLMERIANEGCHYEVDNADDLVYFFGDIADQLSGQKYIYVRIACPVNVKVAFNGQELNSDEESASLRTDFGTLTFEETDDPDDDDQVKVLRLKEGVDYKIEIEGYARGKMDYTIGYMDESGKYSDLRRFKSIAIRNKTIINTIADNSDSTVLNVDEDGDGKYDLFYEAEKNGRGKEISFSSIKTTFTVIIVLIVLLSATIAIIIACKKRIKAKIISAA